MYNFFVESNARVGDVISICGGDFNHVKNVLRMKVGEQILVSIDGTSALCQIFEFTESSVIAKIIEENFQDTSLPVSITLFQGLPKADKMELILQKPLNLVQTKSSLWKCHVRSLN